MDAAAILARLHEVGVKAIPEGTSLVLEPGSKVPPDLYEPIRANKPQIMEVLRRSNTPVAEASAKWSAERVARDTIQYGICIFWSDLFQETVAFISGEKHRLQVPCGIAVYTCAEIAMLFPAKGQSVQRATLLLIHEGKKLAGARVIDVKERRYKRT